MIVMIQTIFSKLESTFQFLKKTILVIAVFVTVVHLFYYFTDKELSKLPEDIFETRRAELYTIINDKKFQETDVGKMQVAIYRFVLCSSIGETCQDNPSDVANNYNNSLMGKASGLITSPYAQPPASGVTWTYEGLANAGFVPQSQAQGIGFYALQPIALIWKVFRNISYLLIVLVTISIGFMIMFRANLGSQTVIAIENALPRIVIALLLITFSFAIAGFLIDLMYIVMGLGGSVIISNIAADSTKAAELASTLGWESDVFNQSGWALLGKIVGNGNIWNTGSAFLSILPYQLQLSFRYLVANAAVVLYAGYSPTFDSIRKGEGVATIPAVGGILKLLFSSLVGNLILGLAAGILLPMILSLAVWISCLFLFFRIFFILLLTYTKIILSIIFAPIVLLFEAFPSTSTFSYWFKGLFFNLMTFPIVAVLIMVSGLIANVAILGTFNGQVFNSTEVGFVGREFWRPPFLYTIETDGFVMLVAISIIFLIPDFLAFIKKSFGVEDLPFSISPTKLLAGSGTAANAGYNLMMRSRTLTREFGWTRDRDPKGWNRVIAPFLSEDPNEALAKVLNRQPTQTGAT